MKHIIIILVCGIFFSGCKKYYSCECTFTDPVSSSSVTTAEQMGKLKKKDAEDDCALIQDDLVALSGDCKIVKE